jgi:hypothetical protein
VSKSQVSACCLLYRSNGVSAADRRRSSLKELVNARFSCYIDDVKPKFGALKGLSISS